MGFRRRRPESAEPSNKPNSPTVDEMILLIIGRNIASSSELRNLPPAEIQSIYGQLDPLDEASLLSAHRTSLGDAYANQLFSRQTREPPCAFADMTEE